MAKAVVNEEIKAAYLINGANNGRYMELKNSLENDFTKGQDKGPRASSWTSQSLQNELQWRLS